jgi:hypothetical protein
MGRVGAISECHFHVERRGRWGRLFGPEQEPEQARRVRETNEQLMYAEAYARLDWRNMTADVLVGIVVELAETYLPVPRGYTRTWRVGWRRRDAHSDWMPVLSASRLELRAEFRDPSGPWWDMDGMPVKHEAAFTLGPEF